NGSQTNAAGDRRRERDDDRPADGRPRDGERHGRHAGQGDSARGSARAERTRQTADAGGGEGAAAGSNTATTRGPGDEGTQRRVRGVP
ncbi:hypothetical protein C3R44_22315, partial [Mycobacterium tuberculosis]